MSAAAIALGLSALAILAGAALTVRRIRADQREERRRGLNRPAQGSAADRRDLGKSCLSALLLGFAPTILLVATYEFAPVDRTEKIHVAAAAFGLAVLAALAFRLLKPLPEPARFPWRNLLALLMAGLTVALREDLFIKIRPTVTSLVGAMLAIAALSGFTPELDSWLDRHRRSLDDRAARKLLLGSAFAGMLYAALNLYIWRTAAEPFWVYFQLWGPLLFFGLFALLGYLLLKDQLPVGQCPAQARDQRSDARDDQ